VEKRRLKDGIIKAGSNGHIFGLGWSAVVEASGQGTSWRVESRRSEDSRELNLVNHDRHPSSACSPVSRVGWLSTRSENLVPLTASNRLRYDMVCFTTVIS
jgi:hypothetical protein